MRDHFNFQLAVTAIKLTVCRTIRNGVLITNIASDVFERINHVAFESGLIEPAARQLGECLHLIVRLQPIDLGHVHAGYPVRSPSAAVSLTIFAQQPTNADWENGDVVSCLNFLRYLVQVEFAEGV